MRNKNFPCSIRLHKSIFKAFFSLFSRVSYLQSSSALLLFLPSFAGFPPLCFSYKLERSELLRKVVQKFKTDTYIDQKTVKDNPEQDTSGRCDSVM